FSYIYDRYINYLFLNFKPPAQTLTNLANFVKRGGTVAAAVNQIVFGKDSAGHEWGKIAEIQFMYFRVLRDPVYDDRKPDRAGLDPVRSSVVLNYWLGRLAKTSLNQVYREFLTPNLQPRIFDIRASLGQKLDPTGVHAVDKSTFIPEKGKPGHP